MGMTERLDCTSLLLLLLFWSVPVPHPISLKHLSTWESLRGSDTGRMNEKSMSRLSRCLSVQSIKMWSLERYPHADG
jgi:hypothetical protein